MLNLQITQIGHFIYQNNTFNHSFLKNVIIFAEDIQDQI